MTEQDKLAHEFIEAIKKLVAKEDNLYNFECYLGRHFAVWMKRYANDPESLVSEMKSFAEMEI